MSNSLFVLLLLGSAVFYVAAQPRVSSKISQGSSLKPTGTSSWLSPSGLFAFGFYSQGDNRYGVGIFLAGLPLNKSTVVWTANRDDPPVSDDATLHLTSAGELVLQQQSPGSARDVVPLNNQSISSVSMLDSGNFVLYDSNQGIIWQSFDHPTDTILPGQQLIKEQELFSSKSELDHSTGIFRLKMQSDSNLVQYPMETGTTDTFAYAYWASVTNVANGVNVTLNLDSDGHLYLLNNSVSILKNLSDGRPEKQRFYLMKIHYDGILRLYSLSLDGKGNSSSVVWESSDDGCDPKGLCGLNGYCSLYDNKPKCECPPGFDYDSPGDWSAGCKRINTADNCNKEQRIQYNMNLLNNTYWENNAYRTHNVKIKEECEEACLQDCECVVAFFQDRECRKQRFPLRYGRNVSSDSNIAYIKVALPPPPPPTRKKDTYHSGSNCRYILFVGIGAGLVVMVVVLLLSYWGVRQHRQKQNLKVKENFFKQNGGIMLQQLLHKTESTAERAKIYTEEELKKATDNYNEGNIIGQGGSGTVYKGVLDETLVAIKKSKVVDRSQIDQFVNEVIILSQITHTNVVKLLGCCLETPVPLLVYEFVTNEILFHHLHDIRCASSLSWDMRLRIATETAKALAHMHSAPVHIIHRDVKSANILLNDEYTAKVSDFGVSRLFSLEETHLATLVQGTFGYIDPEYFHSGILTQKSDVYSFGVVLVEFLTGANVVSFDREEKDINLGMYFLFAMEDDRLHEILEPRVRKEGNGKQLRGVAELAKKCLRIKGDKRPTMKVVEEELTELRKTKIENHSWVETGPYVEDSEPLLQEVTELYDSYAMPDFDSM